MKDRIDPLIAERAPWLYRDRPDMALARGALERLLGYPLTLALGERLRDLPAPAIMNTMARLIARDVRIDGIENIPRDGAALIVSNHPTGIADGIMVWHAIAERRPDAYFFANSDILRVLPQMDALICPVEWREDKRSRARTRETLAYSTRAMSEGRLGVVFPSGRLAQRRGLRLQERPWMPSAVSLARRHGVVVIPIHIAARNSALFYLFDTIHETLRDITLFHETLNKHSQPYHIRIGTPIAARSLPEDVPQALARLRHATLRLGGQDDVSLIETTRPGLAARAQPASGFSRG